MEIDIYQTCPCHTEKKIKFCCGKDIVSDLNKILTLSKSRQAIAALENLDRAISKLGPRDCLLTIKTHLLITLHEYDRAREVNEQFQAAHPNHPVGHQHRAMLLAAEGDATAAIEALQDALDAVTEHQVPVSMSNAFRVVGMLLMSTGDIMACRAHLTFAMRLRGAEDEIASRLLAQITRSPEVPLQLKHDYAPTLVETDEAWSKRLNNAIRYAARGQWRQAVQRAEALEAEFPDAAPVVQAVAAWNATLSHQQKACEAFGRLAALPSLAYGERVDAESLKLILDQQPLTEPLDLLRVTFDVDDAQGLAEQAAASPRLIAGTVMDEQFAGDGPPPLAAYLLLDRDEIKSAKDATDQMPSVMAELLLFGKQTNRAARLELMVVRDDRFEMVQRDLASILDQWISEPVSTDTVNQVSRLDHAMSFQWHLPRDMSADERREFIAERRRNEILDVWTTIPFNALGGQSAEQASGDPSKSLTLAALVSMMEQGADAQLNTDFDFDALREKLGLPLPEPIDPAGLDIMHLSPVRLQQVEFAKLDDESLMRSYILASTAGNFRALRKCATVVLERPQLEKYLRFESVYLTLAKLTMNPTAALEWMHRARHHASSNGRSVGHLLVEELELRLGRGLIENCSELLRTIQANHSSDPEVQYHLANVLQRFGIVDSEGMVVGRLPEEPAPAAEAATSSTIWTPDSEAPVSGGAGKQQKSKLWLPDLSD